MEFYLKQYLYTLYSQEGFKNRIHLDGGAALKFFYNIDRKFSNDLDFTIEDDGSANRFKEFITNYFKGNTEYTVNTSENRIQIQKGNKEFFHIDYYVVPAKYCNYSSKQLSLDGNPSIDCLIHSVEDILVEKIFCLVSRTECRDITDINSIINNFQIDPNYIDKLIASKNRIKNVKEISNLKSTLELFIKNGKSRFNRKYNEFEDQVRNFEYKLKDIAKC